MNPSSIAQSIRPTYQRWQIGQDVFLQQFSLVQEGVVGVAPTQETLPPAPRT